MAEDAETPEVEEQEEPAEAEEVEDAEEAEPEGEEPEGESEADPEPEGEEPEEPPKRSKSDREENLGKLRRENRDLHERIERLERGGTRQPDPAAAAEAQRREREEDEQVILSADPARISQHFATKVERRLEGRVNQVVSAVVDTADRTEFRSLCAENQSVAAVKDEVERRLQVARSNGLNPKREALAFYIIGERVAQRAKGSRTRQERRAATDRDRQRARPGAARSDVSSRRERGGRDTHAERAKRLDESGQL